MYLIHAIDILFMQLMVLIDMQNIDSDEQG